MDRCFQVSNQPTSAPTSAATNPLGFSAFSESLPNPQFFNLVSISTVRLESSEKQEQESDKSSNLSAEAKLLSMNLQY